LKERQVVNLRQPTTIPAQGYVLPSLYQSLPTNFSKRLKTTTAKGHHPSDCRRAALYKEMPIAKRSVLLALTAAPVEAMIL
jgi:hypothetical protein